MLGNGKLKYIISFKHDMAKFIEMDDNVKFLSQLEEDAGPIVFVNKFTVNPRMLMSF
jgi:hypothetical protein